MHSDQELMNLEYAGEKGPLFRLALKTGLLTLVTLGIYRFWQKTRIRKYIWSSVSAGGDTFEYTGTGLEKFLGFLVAIVFLAIYLGAFQLILFYFGLSVLIDPETAEPEAIIRQVIAIYASFFAVLPFLLFAMYRARRYQMARTRFRGIRLGMEKGAWGFVARALGYGLLSLITLGILSPLSTFKLEKYMTDRSFYGDARLHQEGKWTALFPAMKHIFIALGILIASGILIATGANANSIGLSIIGGIGIFVGYIWLFIGSVYYAVKSFAYLMSNKVLDGQVRFVAEPEAKHVIKTYILGYLLVSLLASVAFGIAFALAMPFIMMMENGQPGGVVGFSIVLAIGYMVALVVTQALSLILVTQPVLAHYIETIRIVNPQALDSIHQRAAETGIDAEGFADALDIGGAI